MSENDLFSKLWNELVPAQGEPDTAQGELVWAIGRLNHEWRNNGNGNWDKVDFYLDMTERLWDVLVYEESNYEDEESEEIEDYLPENFDAAKNEQIKQDLRLIEMLGMVVKLHPSEEQANQILQIVASSTSTEIDYDGAFDRIKQTVIDWCREHPVLQRYSFMSSEDDSPKSIAHIFE